jgi:23S rRNA (guanosine2251-2'-O)-methyltransferase
MLRRGQEEGCKDVEDIKHMKKKSDSLTSLHPHILTSSQISYGFHSVQTLLQQSPQQIQQLYVQEGKPDQRLQPLIKLAEQHHISIQRISREQLDALVEGGLHQGIVASCTEQKSLVTDIESLLEQLSEPAFLLILDGVQDPHNLGACLRSANAAGVHAVIAPKDRAVGITPVVRKVASGAAEITPFIQVTNLVRTMEILKDKGIWLYGAAEDATENLYEIDLTGPIAIVLGAEGTGLRRLTREHCDKLMRIPTQGNISSLNVSVATGVCLFEALRQRFAIERKS